MALMIGAAADALTAWQQAVVAGVFELCLVGVMVIYELLGHRKTGWQAHVADTRPDQGAGQHASRDGPRIGAAPTTAAPRRARTNKAKPPNQHVRAFFEDYVRSEPRSRAEMKALTRDIRAWASGSGLVLPGMSDLLDEIAAACRERGIEIEVGDDQRVYCLGIRLAEIRAGAGSSIQCGAV
jgi:hypothetical protein